MVVAICIEASHRRGAGHLFRSQVLARELARLGCRVLIVVNECAQAQEQLRASGLDFRVAAQGPGWEKALVAENQVDLWINDRLDTDAEHGQAMRSLGLPLVTFDDRGEGAHEAFLNVCALAGGTARAIPGRRVLTGEEWLVLNPALAQRRRQRTRADSLLVTLGGSDTYGVTLRIVRLLARSGRCATVLTGPLFAHETELAALAKTADITWRKSVPDMGELFQAHDLAITGGGITPFEAVSTGLPVVIVANEPHEVAVGQRLESLGCALFAGFHEELDEGLLLDLPMDVSGLSAAGMRCVPLDGAQRVCREILHV